MSRRGQQKPVQFSRAGFNAGSGAGAGEGGGGKVARDPEKKLSLKEGRDDDSVFDNLFAVDSAEISIFGKSEMQIVSKYVLFCSYFLY